jgi:predicted dehydrogenase
MSRQLRFGVLGAGQVSRMACPELSRHPQAKIVAVSDPHPERLAAFSELVGGITTYADNEALLGDPELDAVYIATPNAMHAPLALRALATGKHVIVEKPMATSAAEVRAMIDQAERSERQLCVGMNQRFFPDSQRLAQLVRKGAIGHVYHAKAYWFRRAGIPKLGSWFCQKALAGGGALYDIGVHVLDLALYLMDRFDPVSVSGQVYSTFGARGLGEGGWGLSEREHETFDVDDSACALLRFADGATLTFDVSWARHQRQADSMNVVLSGTEGGAGCFPGERYSMTDSGEYQTQPLPKIPLIYPHESRFHNFIGAILGTEPACVPPSQALAVQRILDAIYESSRLGREVMLSNP